VIPTELLPTLHSLCFEDINATVPLGPSPCFSKWLAENYTIIWLEDSFIPWGAMCSVFLAEVTSFVDRANEVGVVYQA
jgi:hypothetical protein